MAGYEIYLRSLALVAHCLLLCETPQRSLMVSCRA
jgi:hypothetical protein